MKKELCFLSSKSGRGHMTNESKKNNFVSNFFSETTKKTHQE